jgi:hypothetical protein
MVNTQREFFYATPGEVKEVLQQFEGTLLSYVDEQEALEWRQTATVRADSTVGQGMVDA